MNTANEIRQRVRTTVRDMAPNPDGWNVDDPHLSNDLEYHSLALVELAFVLEDMFQAPPITEVSAAEIRTVRDVEDYVLTVLSERAG